jgi:hypothetical protein
MQTALEAERNERKRLEAALADMQKQINEMNGAKKPAAKT